jgi:hypothetical protein
MTWREWKDSGWVAAIGAVLVCIATIGFICLIHSDPCCCTAQCQCDEDTCKCNGKNKCCDKCMCWSPSENQRHLEEIRSRGK